MDATVLKDEEKKTRIVEAISVYKQQHPKWSPSDEFLSREAQIPVSEVKYFIRQLENDGVIGVVGSWPRQLWVINDSGTATGIINGAGKKEENAEMLTTRTEPQQRHEKWGYLKAKTRTPRIGLKKRAKQVAEAIETLASSKGKVFIKDISMLVFGHDQTGHVSNLIVKMKEKGWVHHSKRRWGDIYLTDKGRIELLGWEPQPKPEPLELTVEHREALTNWSPAEPSEFDVTRSEPPQPEQVPEGYDAEDADPRPEEPVTYTEQADPGYAGEPRVRQSVMAQAIHDVAVAVAEEVVGKFELDLSRITDEQLVLEAVNRGYTISKR